MRYELVIGSLAKPLSLACIHDPTRGTALQISPRLNEGDIHRRRVVKGSYPHSAASAPVTVRSVAEQGRHETSSTQVP